MNLSPPAIERNTVRSLMTIPEVAHRLRVGRTTIYALLGQGAPLRVVHIGRAARIEASSVDAFIDQLAHSEDEAQQDGQAQHSA